VVLEAFLETREIVLLSLQGGLDGLSQGDIPGWRRRRLPVVPGMGRCRGQQQHDGNENYPAAAGRCKRKFKRYFQLPAPRSYSPAGVGHIGRRLISLDG
jgi:hypothetical protein